MLAFLAVILVTVGTMAFLVGWITETEFRRYAMTHGGMWNRPATELAAYYATHGSWEGIQERLENLPGRMGPMMGSGNQERHGGPPAPLVSFRLTDAEGRVVASTDGLTGDVVPQRQLDDGILIEVNDRVAGYLLPSVRTPAAVPLDQPQLAFLRQVRIAVWIAALAALSAALIIGGLLFRSIVAPLRRLTAASRAIAAGDLSARAPVRGRDEVAQLARSFNDMAESLAQAEEARRNQTADIAHELRTPLTLIQGTLEAMLDGIYRADRENLVAALGQVRTLNRLIEDLRLLALADAGRLPLHKVPLDVREILREAVEASRPKAHTRDIALELEAPPAMPLVLADRDRLAQVVGNLLDNALRYVPEGGYVTVRVEDRAREVIVSVIDDGPGVPMEDLPHLFDRFWRGDASRRRETGGSGLGLAIARHIVEAHDGHIWAEPTPGGGLTVSFTLRTAALA